MTKQRRERKHYSHTSDYRIGGVRYIVSSRFVPPGYSQNRTMESRLRHCLASGLVVLTENRTENTMKAEYMCPAAGKEE